MLAYTKVGGTKLRPFVWAASLIENRCGFVSATLVAIKVSF